MQISLFRLLALVLLAFALGSLSRSAYVPAGIASTVLVGCTVLDRYYTSGAGLGYISKFYDKYINNG
jgi:hypothetical protein